MTKITITYRSCDGVRRTKHFKSLQGAQNYARYWVGPTPEVGGGYVVSSDGIGRLTWEGCKTNELFPALGLEQSGDFEGIRIDLSCDMFEVMIGDTHLGHYPTRPLAQEAYDEAQAYAAAMCGHYQRSCEDGSLYMWEREQGDF